MKKIALILSVLMVLTLLVGCVESNVPETGYDAAGQSEVTQDVVSNAGEEDTGATNKTDAADSREDIISESDAKSIALTKADVKADDVSRLEIDLDYDNDQKRWEYEVDFYVEKVEYEVDIDATNGKVLLFKKDDNTVSKATKATEKSAAKTKATTASDSNSSSDLISKSRAKEIALDKANVKASEISRYRIKTDYDDDRNRWEYEIDFYVGNVEYDVTIDAVKGTVVEFERDEDEEKKATATTEPTFVSKDDVKSIALLCAGVKESKVSDYEAELDYDDDSQRWEYEVTFSVGRIEYDVLVDAETGELIHWEKEIDD